MSVFTRVLANADRERGLRPEAGRHDEDDASQAPAPNEQPAPRPTQAPRPDEPYPFELPQRVEAHLVSLLHPTSFMAEPYRSLRHIVEQRQRTGRLSVVAVSSAASGEGKTTTSINLAGALAQAPGSRVLLVDADLRNSSIGRHLALGELGNHGLVEAILDPNLRLDDVVRALPAFNLHVLAAGTLPATPYEVLQSPRLEEILEEARRRYDFVIVDTAPLVPVPDSRIIAKLVDGVLLVVGAHKTPSKLLAQALNLMEPAKMIGLVFNGDDETPSSHHDYPADGAGSNGHRSPRWRSLWRRPSMTVRGTQIAREPVPRV
jgi:capsular exopolysaccharide synthesis family protein